MEVACTVLVMADLRDFQHVDEQNVQHRAVYQKEYFSTLVNLFQR